MKPAIAFGNVDPDGINGALQLLGTARRILTNRGKVKVDDHCQVSRETVGRKTPDRIPNHFGRRTCFPTGEITFIWTHRR